MASQIQIEVDEQTEVTQPKRYKVFLLNDDYSTMDFVIDILVNIFKKTNDEATQIMLTIHKSGKAVCGIYTHEIAATKVAQVRVNARKAQFPLKAILEEE